MELIPVVETSSVTSEQALAWLRRVEAQRTQTTMLDSLKETKDFDAIRSQKTWTKANQTTTGKIKYRPFK